jgi:hypothetical protein
MTKKKRRFLNRDSSLNTRAVRKWMDEIGADTMPEDEWRKLLAAELQKEATPKDNLRVAKERWLQQAEKILSLFADANGRPARTMEELTAWAASADGKRYLSAFRDANGHIIPD